MLFFLFRTPLLRFFPAFIPALALCLLHGLANAEPPDTKAVTTHSLAEVAVYPMRSAPARVISLNEPAISAQLNARLTELVPLVGQRVNRGDVIARLDCREFLLNKRSAEAQLANIEARQQLAANKLQRAKSLVANQLLSEQELDARNSELRALMADQQAASVTVALMELQVERCDIRAPFNALVTERAAEVGQLLSPGTPVIKLLDLSQIEITAQIVAADAERLDAVTDFALDTNGKKYPVTLRTLVDAIASATRNREARFIFVGEPALIGSAGKIVWRDPRPHVSPDLLVERNGKLGIFVIRDGNSIFVPLKNAQAGRSTPVDLPPDSRIVTGGYLGLSNGEAVVSSR